MSMDVNSLILIATVTVVELSAVGVGYWMGRNSSGRALSDTPRAVNLTKVRATITEDPYVKAMRPPDVGRISTLEEEDK